MRVMADALHYFGKHFSDPIQIPSMAESLGITWTASISASSTSEESRPFRRYRSIA
jgi:hypothetical protein